MEILSPTCDYENLFRHCVCTTAMGGAKLRQLHPLFPHLLVVIHLQGVCVGVCVCRWMCMWMRVVDIVGACHLE